MARDNNQTDTEQAETCPVDESNALPVFRVTEQVSL